MQKLSPYLVLFITSILLLMPFPADLVLGAPGDVNIKLNGEIVSSDVPAYIDTNGRTMVPVRFVMQALGSQVEWDGDRQQVSIQRQGQTIQLWINTNRAIVNGKTVDLDTVPVLRNDRTMVPLRFVAETLGMVVKWVGESATVELSQGAAPAPTIRIAVVTGNNLNIRSGPDTSYSRIDQVPQGTRLTVVGQQGEWFEVQLPDKRKGWVAGWYVRLEEPEQGSGPREVPPGDEVEPTLPPPTARVAVVMSDVVNVRTGPGTDRQVLTKVSLGQRLEVLGQEGDWYRVKVLGKEGWIAGWLVDVREVVPAPASPDNGAGGQPLLEIKKTAIIMGETVNIRLAPEITSPLVGQVELGTRLEITGEQDRWYKVKTPDGVGWVARWLVATHMVANLPEDENTGDNPVEIGRWGTGAGPGTAVPGGASNLVTGLRVDQTIGGITLRVSAANSLTPLQALRLDNPSRLVFDMPGVLKLETGELVPAIQVGRSPVVQVRTSQLTPDTVRVVVDLDRPAAYETKTENDGKVVTISIRPASLAGRTIVIDAGHGSLQPGDWTDPGAIGPTGLKERDVVLDIAWRVSEKLLAEGATVIMTRTGDTNLTLPERSAVANNNGADMLVSIHANASPTSSIAGTSTYYHAPWGTEWETQVETRKRLARSIQAELLQKLQRQDQGVREANFSVLRNSMVPSVLVETAFISNPEEERLLADPTFRELAAEGIVSGIKRYVVSQ